jgi:hypothetical protein
VRISYCDGYKYQLVSPWHCFTGIEADAAHDEWIRLDEGLLTVNAGYAWDGPSGPTIDTKNFMRGSLAHDALYQLMREGRLPTKHRKAADDLLYSMCREDGMSWLRAQIVYGAVRAFSAPFAQKQKRKVLTAP